ncbi:hypothetical protein ABI214_08000 [Prescottella soli]|uniref:Uncharacterized protein n=1 Tax=Prescottella soli TaxID=1543852 RepID=A0ABW9FNP0_9NOCA
MNIDDTLIGTAPETSSNPTPIDGKDTRRFLGRACGTLAVTTVVFVLTMLLPGPLRSLQTIGTLSTFGLGPLLVLSVWWPRWTRWGSRTVPPIVAAFGTTLALIVLAVAFAGLALAVVGRFDVAGLFSAAAAQSEGVLTPFPFVTTLGVLTFVSMLHVTFVLEKWPFDTAQPIRDGLLAFAFCSVLAVATYFVVANWDGIDPSVLQVLGVLNPGGPVDALELVGWLAWIACLDVVVMVLLRGWPFDGIRSRRVRIAVTGTTIPMVGTALYVVARREFDVSSTAIAAAAAMAITAVFVMTIAFDGRLLRGIRSAATERTLSLAVMCVLAAVLYAVLIGIAGRFESWTEVPPQLWVAVSGLNILAPTLILHDSVWNRWPFRPLLADSADLHTT